MCIDLTPVASLHRHYAVATVCIIIPPPRISGHARGESIHARNSSLDKLGAQNSSMTLVLLYFRIRSRTNFSISNSSIFQFFCFSFVDDFLFGKYI